MHDWKKLLIIPRQINAQKLDSQNKLRGYAYFANSVLFAKECISRIFSKGNLKTIVPIFFGQVEIF